MNNVDTKTIEQIRDTLAQCEELEELDRKTYLRIWRAWVAAYPLDPVTHRGLESDIVARLCAVRRTLKGRHARAAYERQTSPEILFLCVHALAGWKCRCTRAPRLHDIDATLLVTSTDFAWTFGTHEHWQLRTLYGGPVFAEPAMLPEKLM